MMAYQMIYTGCGKNKTGDFSIWSKSTEVTKAECDDLTKLMSYRMPKGAPFDPTEEELKTKFPKKYGYFILSSGRKCIVQTCFLGKVYSDQDNRGGNFIIHAYIFEKSDNICPFGIVNTGVFKNALTYREWHDDPIPDSLPAVNIEVKPYVDEAEARKFLADYSKTAALSSLLQSVILAVDNAEKAVTFNSTEEEQKLLYSMIGYLLPRNISEKATFANQYAPQIEYSISNIESLPKIRNIFNINFGSSFNYEEEIAVGSYAFDFEHGRYAEVAAGRYVTDIINIAKTKSMQETVKVVEEIGRIMGMLTCDVDTATAVYHFINGHFDWFTNASDFISAMKLAVGAGAIDKAAYAKNIYTTVLKTKRFGFDSTVTELINFVYTNSDAQTKDALIFDIMNATDAFGVSAQMPRAYLDAIKSVLPVPYPDIVACALRTPALNSMLKNSTNACVTYLYVDVIVSTLEKNPTPDASQRLQAELLSLLRRAVGAKDLNTVQLYFERAKTLGAGVEESLVTGSIANLLSAPSLGRDDIKFVFDYAMSLSSLSLQAKILANVILKNMQSSDLIPVYLDTAAKNRDFFDKLEAILKQENTYAAFFTKKEAYVFRNMPLVTADALNKYFKDYYLTGNDSGVYLIKLKEFISGITNPAQKLMELFARYDMIANLENNHGDVMRVTEYIEKEICSEEIDTLLKLAPGQIETLKKINARLTSAGITPSKKYNTLLTVMLLSGKLGQVELENAIGANRVYARLSLPHQLENFTKSYFDLIIKCCVSKKKEDAAKRAATLEALIGYIYADADARGTAPTNLYNTLAQLDGKTYGDFMAMLMAYAFNSQAPFAKQMMTFLLWYFDQGISVGQCKKLFKQIQPLIEESEYKAVAAYTDEYLDKHRGFFSKLFGGKKKTKENEE